MELRYHHKFDLIVKQHWKLVSIQLFSSSRKGSWTSMQLRDHWWNDQHRMPRPWLYQGCQNVDFYPSTRLSQFQVIIERPKINFASFASAWKKWFKVIIIHINFWFFRFMDLISYKIITFVDYKSLTLLKCPKFIIFVSKRYCSWHGK